MTREALLERVSEKLGGIEPTTVEAVLEVLKQEGYRWSVERTVEARQRRATETPFQGDNFPFVEGRPIPLDERAERHREVKAANRGWLEEQFQNVTLHLLTSPGPRPSANEPNE